MDPAGAGRTEMSCVEEVPHTPLNTHSHLHTDSEGQWSTALSPPYRVRHDISKPDGFLGALHIQLLIAWKCCIKSPVEVLVQAERSNKSAER